MLVIKKQYGDASLHLRTSCSHYTLNITYSFITFSLGNLEALVGIFSLCAFHDGHVLELF